MILEANRFTLFGLNPNDVAIFIVIGILTMPVLLGTSKRWLWVIAPIEVLFIGLLIGTGSRGGVMALALGMAVLLFFYWRLGMWPSGRGTWVMAAGCIVLGVIGGLFIFPKGFRLGTMDVSPEASAGRRIEVWSTVPAMLASAPNGWGRGNSADAYEQWYEPTGKFVELKHLLSSHLTWLVEFSWTGRWGYLFFWMSAWIIVAPDRKFKFPPWGVAVWTAFAVALFYNAAGKWWNWPIPILWLMAAIVYRCVHKSAPSLRSWLVSAILSGALVASPFLFFLLWPPPLQVQGQDSGNVVTVGKGEPAVAILEPSKKVLGNFYGQALRKHLLEKNATVSAVTIMKQPDRETATLLKGCRVFVFSGADETILKHWEPLICPQAGDKLVLINCRVQLDEWIKRFDHVMEDRGEFFADPFSNDWNDLRAANSKISVTVISRREAYIPDWCSLWEGPAGK